VRLEGVDEDLLQLMLQEKHAQDELLKEIQQMKSEEDDNEENVAKDRKVMFKNRKKAIFKNYNKILAESTTTFCRVCVKTLIGIAVFVIVFFGLFIINGGYGLIRSYYFNPITLQVPYNYGTSLIDMTILTTNGANIMDLYSQYSY
jgi:Fe2+ transport system protein B